MKRIDLLYWAVTGLLSVQLLAAVAMYFTDPAIRAGFAHLGFPDYFRVELGIAKGLGAVAILLPLVPLRVKEWAYAGLAFTFLSAIVAQAAVDGLATGGAPVGSLVLLAASYILLHRRARPISPGRA
jgi:hypothetical protein